MKRRVSIVTAAWVFLVLVAPAAARDRPSLAFRAPGDIAYCGYVTLGWECFSPKTDGGCA